MAYVEQNKYIIRTTRMLRSNTEFALGLAGLPIDNWPRMLRKIAIPFSRKRPLKPGRRSLHCEERKRTLGRIGENQENTFVFVAYRKFQASYLLTLYTLLASPRPPLLAWACFETETVEYESTATHARR